MHQFLPLTDCWYLTGATASGKTKVALELAELIGAEIISVDSMAVYRGMDIGTAKPTPADQSRVKHHLLDVVDPNEPYSLAEYLATAHAAADEIRSRGRQVLFVGGTPLYLMSLLRGVCEGPPADPEFRSEVEREIARVGLEPLRQRLAQVDPLSAAKLHENDVRRMVRALEVHKLTGSPISHYQLHFDSLGLAPCSRVFVLSWPRSVLHSRINARVTDMFRLGLVQEVRGLLERFGELSPTAVHGVGYREVVEHLNLAENLEKTIESAQTRTRQFARRQETWFRRLAECRWMACVDQADSQEIAREICRQANAKCE